MNKEHSMVKICFLCNYSGDEEDRVCPHCGIELNAKCPACGAPIKTSFAEYCYRCGMEFKKWAEGLKSEHIGTNEGEKRGKSLRQRMARKEG
jgi:predicted amidophosphoribosyltransferase